MVMIEFFIELSRVVHDNILFVLGELRLQARGEQGLTDPGICLEFVWEGKHGAPPFRIVQAMSYGLCKTVDDGTYKERNRCI